MCKFERNEESFQDIQTRYSATPKGLSIINGRRSFNRPLYGNNSAFMLFAGDLPQVMMSLPGRGGTLSLGVISPRASKWLQEFDNIISTYEPGIMHYIMCDSELPEIQIELDVVTSVESDAMVVRITIGNLTYPLDLVWTFGGAAPIHGAPATGNPDPNGYVDELDMLFHPGHCSGNSVELSSNSFSLRAQTTGDRPIYGGCNYQGEFSIHNPKTFTLGPKFFMSSTVLWRGIVLS
ncbi:DUF4450 domain-containing protein [Candidatus Poribacteria bacterium]|nr:DUF4450 domain-containing protein [Candidatus Poribacteria bacterium]